MRKIKANKLFGYTTIASIMALVMVLSLAGVTEVASAYTPEILNFSEDKDFDEGVKLLVSLKDDYPVLSGDFKKVAFAPETKPSELWIMNTDGSNLRKIGEWPEGKCWLIAFFKNGKKILCQVWNSKKSSQPNKKTLWIINSDGTGKKQIAEGVFRYPISITAFLSPDENKVAYTGRDMNIYVVNIDGSGNKLITKADGLISWTSDAEKIEYYTVEGWQITEKSIWRIDINSGIQEKLADIIGKCLFVKISPDGSKIAFQKQGIWLVNLDEYNRKQVTYGEHEGRHYWSPDSNKIAFISYEKGVRHGIWVMDSDGSNQKKVADLESSSYFAGTNSLVWSKDGSKIAYIAENEENQTFNIYTIDVGKPSLVNVPASEAPAFEILFAIGSLLAVAYLVLRRRR